MKTNNSFYLKIFLSLAIAFVLANVSSNTVFFGQTPRFNEGFIAKLINLPADILNSTKNFIVSIGQNTSQNQDMKQSEVLLQYSQLPDNLLKQVASGVYAKEDQINNVLYMRVSKDAQYEPKKIIDENGQEITVLFPKGSFTKN